MGEIKSVKVDNWGVFFLQKLQNFFNKTDYCDLTLQFRDNSQLKVHRLVLSACTDYFNVLEQTCDMVDDALIMPIELQADVVVPIVNFMYTGTLEFELKMYGRLLRTAKEMNMTVLLKLLEAHRRTMEGVNRSQCPPSPKAIRRRGPPPAAGTASPQQVQQQRRILASANVSPQRRNMQLKSTATNTAQTQAQQHVITYRQQIGSTAVMRTTSVKQEPQDYESQTTLAQATSPFEQLRRGYNNNKRPASSTFVSPPAKKPNIEDVKEFAEQQLMRKKIAAEYGEDPEYEGMLDDDIHDDDDDEEGGAAAAAAVAAAAAATSAAPSEINEQQVVQRNTGTHATVTARQKNQQQQHHEQATITIKQEQDDRPATIIVKDSSNSKMNHTKIISEVLRQYPHLVKGNKNIKLKIIPNAGGQSQKIIVKKEPSEEAQPQQHATVKTASITPAPTAHRLAQPQNQQQSQVTIKKVQTSTTTTGTNATQTGGGQHQQAAAAASTGQKRRIDSKTMHALIALGAENTSGKYEKYHELPQKSKQATRTQS